MRNCFAIHELAIYLSIHQFDRTRTAGKSKLNFSQKGAADVLLFHDQQITLFQFIQILMKAVQELKKSNFGIEHYVEIAR